MTHICDTSSYCICQNISILVSFLSQLLELMGLMLEINNSECWDLINGQLPQGPVSESSFSAWDSSSLDLGLIPISPGAAALNTNEKALFHDIALCLRGSILLSQKGNAYLWVLYNSNESCIMWFSPLNFEKSEVYSERFWKVLTICLSENDAK